VRPAHRAVLVLAVLALALATVVSPTAAAFPFTDPALTAGSTPVRAVHVTELRTHVGTLRTRNALGAFAFTDAGLGAGTTVKAAHVVELRTALAAVYTAMGLTPPVYTDATLTAGETAIKAIHLTQLRNAVNAADQFKLTVARAGAGAGTVTSDVAGIDCGGDCTQFYPTGQVVTLTATPAADSVFSGWSGACAGTDPCTVTMSAARSATATFALKTFTLTVTLAGTGTGTVTSDVAGIACGADCTQAYTTGTVVTLTATPAAGSVFAGWSGACAGTGTCPVTMTQARAVTATFNVSAPAITLSALSHTSRNPGQRLSLTASGFATTAQIFVRFFDGTGFDAKVLAAVESATTIRAGVPPYFSVGTGQFTASPAPVSVQVLQGANGSGGTSNTLGGLTINALPATAVSAGTRAAQWFDRTIQETEEAIRRLDSIAALFPNATSHATLRNQLASQLTLLNTMRSELTAIQGGGTVGFGEIADNAVQLDAAALALIDRFMEALLQEILAEAAASQAEAAALSMPFQLKPGAELSVSASLSTLETDPILAGFDEMFAAIREGVARNRDVFSSVGQAMIATGGLIALTPGGQVPGVALAGLGALTWFVGVHANTAILLSLDVGTTETLTGETGYDQVTQDITAYITNVATNGASYAAGVMNEAVGTFLNFVTLGNELRSLTTTYIQATTDDFDAGRIPEDGASDLPEDQSCCVIHGGCPGETGSSCAINCCCCGFQFACDKVNPVNGCIFVGE
jgi:hypothetical protein